MQKFSAGRTEAVIELLAPVYGSSSWHHFIFQNLVRHSKHRIIFKANTEKKTTMIIRLFINIVQNSHQTPLVDERSKSFLVNLLFVIRYNNYCISNIAYSYLLTVEYFSDTNSHCHDMIRGSPWVFRCQDY